VGKGLQALGVPLLQGYGLTETSPVVTLHPPSETDPVSVGRPLPGVEVKIHDPSEAGDGEVWVRGVTVMRGYWEDDEATREALRDGWFRTGDLGRFVRRGQLCITGRLKNLIVSPGGKNISPEEIEAAAQLCPAVSEIVVYGQPTALGSGEEVCARIFPNLEYAEAQGWPVHDAAALLARVRSQVEEATARLAAYKKIVHYDLVMEPFEKTTSHKIKRQKYRASQPACL
jgi:long-chain acyl-CoA synthetase